MGPKILIVDDDKTIRKLVSQALKDYVCELLEAGDGVEGLAVAQHEHPDLMLLDFSMPVLDGAKMLSKLKADRDLRAIPVIMVTSETARQSVIRVAKLGVRDYLVKPFRSDELIERVGRVVKLEHRHAGGQQGRRFDDALNILVVDDKPAIVQQVQAAFAGTRWSVHGASQRAEVLDFCQKTIPDLVLVSLSLPDGGAFGLFQALREGPRTRATPVLGLSVKTATEEQARAQQLGFAGIVTKPIDFEALEFRVTRALNLDTSSKFFQRSERSLLLTLPAQFNASVANEISAHLRNKVCEAVDAGLNRFVIDLSQLETVDVILIKLGLLISQLCAELDMRYGLIGSEAVRRECKNYAETKDWQFSGSQEEALAMLDAKAPTMA
jgi:two-component system, cell cycle response regulator